MVQMKKHTKGSKGRRRLHHSLKAKTLNLCPKCHQAVEPHRACSFCGVYRSKAVLKIKSKAKK